MPRSRPMKVTLVRKGWRTYTPNLEAPRRSAKDKLRDRVAAWLSGAAIAASVLVIWFSCAERVRFSVARAASVEDHATTAEDFFAASASNHDPGRTLLDEFQILDYTPDPDEVASGRFAESFAESLPLLQSLDVDQAQVVRRTAHWVRLEAPIFDSSGFETGRVRIRLERVDGEWRVEDVRELRARRASTEGRGANAR